MMIILDLLIYIFSLVKWNLNIFFKLIYSNNNNKCPLMSLVYHIMLNEVNVLLKSILKVSSIFKINM